MDPSRSPPGACWARSSRTKSAARPGLDQTAIESPDPGRVAGAEAEGGLDGDLPEGRQHGDHAQDPEGLHARTGRPVGAEQHPVELVEFLGRAEGDQGRAFVAVVDDLDAPPALLAEQRI